MKIARSMVALLAALPLVLSAAEVAGVKVDDNVQVGGAELILNGAGVRTRLMVKVYVGSLHLPERKSDPGDVLALAGAKRVGITMLRDVDEHTFAGALEEGIHGNTDDAELERLKPRIDQLLEIMTSFGEAKKGLVVALDFVPGTGTVVLVNGEPKGNPIPGEDFYRALLRIWLGEKPADAKLKKAMLGLG